MEKWYIAHNGNDVFHYGSIITGQVLTTGQPVLEDFDTEAEFLTRLEALNPAAHDEYLNSKTE